jgi:diphthine synthase
VLRAKGLGCKVKHIYNASIMNAVAGCGLQLYRFGQAVSICFFTRTWRPDSFYDRIKENADLGLHTLLLLDIRVKEPSVEALCRGKKEYEPPRFMSCATCARQMLEVEEARDEKVYGPDSMCVAVARMGQDDELIKTCTLKEMCNIDMGGPLHSMVLVGETHPLENDMLAMHRATENDFLPEDQVPSQYLDDV